MTAPQTNEIRNGVRFRNAALCAAFGALSAMSFIVSGENYQGISDPPASSASYLWCALALCFALLYHTVYGRRKLRPAPVNGAFALIFGVVNAFGVWLYSYDSWAALKNPLTLGLVWLWGSLCPCWQASHGSMTGCRRPSRRCPLWRKHRPRHAGIAVTRYWGAWRRCWCAGRPS